VEATKLSLKNGDDAEKDRATTVLLEVLAESLRLLHPLLPFVTEEIYGKLPNIPAGELLITAPYPEYAEGRASPRVEAEFAFLQELVTQVRTLRSECTIPPDKKLKVLIRPAAERAETLESQAELVKLLAGMGELELQPPANSNTAGESARPQGSIALVGNGFEAFVFITGEAGALKQKFNRDIEKDRKFIAGLTAKLGNEKFLTNAPAALVAEEKVKLEDAVKRTEKLSAYIRDLA
jgi:valyl-tRNA synthetase